MGWIGHRASAEHAAQVETLGSSGLADPPGVIRRVGRPGQQRPPGRDERGHERLQQPLEGDSAIGLHGHHRAVDGGECETREMVGRNRSRHLWSRPRTRPLRLPSRSAWCCSPAPGRRGHPRPAARPVQPHLRGLAAGGRQRTAPHGQSPAPAGQGPARAPDRSLSQYVSPGPPRRTRSHLTARGPSRPQGAGGRLGGGDRRVRDRARWNVAHLDVDPLIKANFGLFSPRAHGCLTSAVARLLAQAEQTPPGSKSTPSVAPGRRCGSVSHQVRSILRLVSERTRTRPRPRAVRGNVPLTFEVERQEEQ